MKKQHTKNTYRFNSKKKVIKILSYEDRSSQIVKYFFFLIKFQILFELKLLKDQLK